MRSEQFARALSAPSARYDGERNYEIGRQLIHMNNNGFPLINVIIGGNDTARSEDRAQVRGVLPPVMRAGRRTLYNEAKAPMANRVR